ncbi:MAG: hypothetical protein ABR865_03820 [Terracidiphilus sp.]|jgi:hypothetical protein
MRKLAAVVFATAAALGAVQAFALEGEDITYVSGTAQNVNEGTVGRVDTSSAVALEFHSGAGKFSIPYTRITTYQCREESKYHLGVLPAIAVGLFAPWAKLHFVTITWHGERDTAEVATLELSKSSSEALLALLRARATGACKPGSGQTCGRVF